MDFFQYASYAAAFTDTFWIQFLIGGLCFALVFAFQAIALFIIASREGYKNKWMAFIPFLNTYYIGVCAQKNKFYNMDTKKIAIAAAVYEALLFGLFVFYYVACSVIIGSDIDPIIKGEYLGEPIYMYDLGIVPSNLKWAAWVYNYMYEYILSLLELVFMLMRVVLLVCFFQTYACRRHVLFTITSILFPIQGILFFVVRNNKGVNYREFLVAKQAREYRIYQQQQQYYNRNPYDRNPYENGNPYQRPQTNTDDPFGDFGGQGDNSGSSPFDEFDN